ncbi:hypothetical protein chiPu_0002029 [Chiloscyllium punctatum]|uniref:Uncharacterized protein n=1 Tax=Chiloscyllium punctatum TaxID=137246 RepID=A0A401RZP5_CHIPU|nr:hypothetical protein [Chiloscyllium punctatum]
MPFRQQNQCSARLCLHQGNFNFGALGYNVTKILEVVEGTLPYYCGKSTAKQLDVWLQNGITCLTYLLCSLHYKLHHWIEVSAKERKIIKCVKFESDCNMPSCIRWCLRNTTNSANIEHVC